MLLALTHAEKDERDECAHPFLFHYVIPTLHPPHHTPLLKTMATTTHRAKGAKSKGSKSKDNTSLGTSHASTFQSSKTITSSTTTTTRTSTPPPQAQASLTKTPKLNSAVYRYATWLEENQLKKTGAWLAVGIAVFVRWAVSLGPYSGKHRQGHAIHQPKLLIIEENDTDE